MRQSLEQQRSLAQVALAYEAQLDERARSYLLARLVDERAVATFHLGFVAEPAAPGHDSYVGRISIPYVTPEGARTIKFRCIEDHDCGDVGCPKYLGPELAQPRMFNAQALATAPDAVAICEGEFDAIVCQSALELPAVAVPGVSTWQPHFPRMFSGIPRVLVLVDNDAPKPRKNCWDERCQRDGQCRGHSPGRDLAKRVARDLNGQAEVIPPPQGQDLTEWIQASGLDSVKKGIGL